jgi:hypothetical protein
MHRMVRVTLANGRSLEVSGSHPLATDGRFEDITAGSVLDGIEVLDVQTVSYAHEFTYDILPASDSGSYFAAGLQLGSTLAPRARAK